ncbi:MAG: DegT/DnrJ/EryC1/StrS aminotransferase family protein [Sedimenticolaceae bacterium]
MSMNAEPSHRVLPTWPTYADDEIAAVQQVLASGEVNYWTGTEGREFEREYAAYVGVDHGIALANGSVALELALRALDIGVGDEVIVTPRTFIASASSIVICGAAPVFSDVDPDSQNITAETIAPHINSRTRAIILVHLAGWPCDMAPILELAKQRDLKIIEDCAQAHGATYDGRPVGSFGDVAAFSFCQDKIITTGGEGGMLVTRSRSLWEKAWSFKDHGKSHAAIYGRKPSREGPFKWVHESFGSNYRMTEMQAAIGRIQLRKLDNWITQRRANAQVLIERLSTIPALRIPTPEIRMHHSYYKFYAFVNTRQLRPGWGRDRILTAINRLDVPCFGGSCSEVYREVAFKHSPFRRDVRLPVARELGDTSLMFPVHPTMTADDMVHIANAIEYVMQQAQA